MILSGEEHSDLCKTSFIALDPRDVLFLELGRQMRHQRQLDSLANILKFSEHIDERRSYLAAEVKQYW